MGTSCSTIKTNANVVEPLPTIKEEKEQNLENEGGVVYRSEPVAVVGVRGIRELKSVGSDYWGEKYVGDR